MNSILTRTAAFAFAALTLAACNDTPTAPEAELATAAAVSNTWMQKADMFGGNRVGMTLATVPNASGQSILYAIGGRVPGGGSLSRVQAYNVSTNRWMYRTEMPSPLYNTNGAGVIDGKIYVSGGRQKTDYKDSRFYLYMYDPATNMWTRKHDMPWYTAEGITGVIDNQLYVITCGQTDFCTYGDLLAVYRYNPATDQWMLFASSPFGGAQAPIGAAINRKFYFVTNGTARLTEYDPATNSWTTKAPAPKPRFGGGAVALGAKLYLIGGSEKQADGSITPVRMVRVYDPGSNMWSTRAMMPKMLDGLSAARVTLNGMARIEVVGSPAPGNNLQYTP